MTKRKINNMHDLKQEKHRLQKSLHTTEKELGAHYTYFSTHYKKIIWSTLNPFKSEGVIGTIGSSLQGMILPVLQEASGIQLKHGEGKESVESDAIKSALVVIALNAIKKWTARKKKKKSAKKASTEEN